MKSIFLGILIALPVSSQAATIQLKGGDAAGLVEAMIYANVNIDKSTPIYQISVASLLCKARYVSHAGSPEDVMWGFAEYDCDNPIATGATARLIYERLNDIQTAQGEKIYIVDCAMGKCFTSLKKLECSIDTNQTQTADRFSCDLTDDQ